MMKCLFTLTGWVCWVWRPCGKNVNLLQQIMCRRVGSWGFRPLFRQRPGVEVFCGVTILDGVFFLWIFRVKSIKPNRFRWSGDVGDGVQVFGVSYWN